VTSPPPPAADTPAAYSPALRTVIVFSGSGTAGAYHAGVLRALHEAGVKIDIAAGCGMGVVAALFAAIDGAGRLWEPNGLWRGDRATGLYPWRPILRLAGWTAVAILAVLCVPLLLLALGLLVYPLDFLLRVVSLDPGAALASGYARLVDGAFAASRLPTWLPGLIAFLIGMFVIVWIGATIAAAWRARRRVRGPFWWKLFGTPLAVEPAVHWALGGLWALMGGAAAGFKQPPPTELGRRYAEILTENLGQPGFRELIVTAYDLDASRDLLFALLAEPARRAFFRRAPTIGRSRLAEAIDLAGAGRDHLPDALAGALSLPVACDARYMTFAPDSVWRGETHRLCHRPSALTRLLEEAAAAGAEQLILVTAMPEPGGPHTLNPGLADPRRRAGDALARLESAVVADAMQAAFGRFDRIFEIRPMHNPLGPLDFGGCHDEQSDRQVTREELIDRGYEDAYSQFVEPIVGASGERLGAEASAPLGRRPVD
jgi:hypothetical protein